jgi:predicted flap endonuclease-1-like 5' DNA nuclease
MILYLGGALVLIILYFLYRTSQSKSDIVVTDQDREEPVVVKAKDYDPTYKPEPMDTVSDETVEPVVKEVETVSIDERLSSIKVIDIEGVGTVYEKSLNDVGILYVGDLLSAGASPEGRKSISEKSGISETLILEWVNICDLYRISGVGEEYSDLLEEAGVDTVPELARRNPNHLLEKLAEINTKKNLVRRLPSLSMVEAWIEEAKKLPRVIEY